MSHAVRFSAPTRYSASMKRFFWFLITLFALSNTAGAQQFFSVGYTFFQGNSGIMAEYGIDLGGSTIRLGGFYSQPGLLATANPNFGTTFGARLYLDTYAVRLPLALVGVYYGSHIELLAGDGAAQLSAIGVPVTLGTGFHVGVDARFIQAAGFLEAGASYVLLAGFDYWIQAGVRIYF